jgi:hypothetical protein
MNSSPKILEAKHNFLSGLFGRNKQKKYIPDIVDPEIISLIPRAKTKAEVAEEYCICEKTLKRRLKRKGIRLPKGIIYPDDLRLIYTALGKPGNKKTA